MAITVRTGPPQDELLRVVGSTNVHTETVTASGNGTPVYFGPNVAVMFELMVTGAVSGTDPTLDVKIQRCADASGTSAEDAASFPQQTASSATATGSLARFPSVIATTTDALPYLRVVKTIGGTSSPTFTGVAVPHEVLPVPII